MGPWLAQLKSPPVDGKANKELVALIARHFACPKSAVSIKSGASGRIKLVIVDGESAGCGLTMQPQKRYKSERGRHACSNGKSS